MTDMDQNEFLQIASSIEHLSEHPLSEAIINKAKDKNIGNIEIHDFTSFSGMGIAAKIDGQAYFAGNLRLMDENNISIGKYETIHKDLSKEGKTSMYFSDSAKVIGLIAVQDQAKESSKIAIDLLKKDSYQITMLTGDNENTAEAIRAKLNIDEKFAEVLPQDKDKVVKKLQADGKKVAMVGDGINDAPALARADIGIAIGSGADVAIDSADVILVKNSLLDIVKAIELSKATIKTIKENLFWAFFYNILLIPVAAGLLYPSLNIRLNPMFASVAMSLSSVFVCLNSLRLRGFKSSASGYEESKNVTIEENILEDKMSEVKKLIVNVDGMSCNNCAKHVNKALSEIEGVKEVDVNLEGKQAEVSYEGNIEEETLKSAIDEAGYEYKGIEYK